MPRNITEMRENLRNAQNELDAQRARNRALVDNPSATAQEIEAAMAETQRLSARARLIQDDLAAEERTQAPANAESSTGSAFTDRRSEILRSNEYARAFAYAITNGISRKKGVGNENIRILYDALTEGGGTPVGSDGGFLVPEDVQNQIIEQVRTLNPLSQYFGEEHVTAPTGWRVTDTAPTKGLLPVNEMGQIQTGTEQPKFAKVPYSCDKYALYLPVSNELATDNVANLFAYLSRWFAKKLVITENSLLVALLQDLTAVDISADPLKGIKKALNVDLDPAISALATVITNQSGFNVLDNLLDDHKRPLLQPDPTNATANRIKGRNVGMVSDATLPNVTSGEGQSATTAADIFIGDGRQFATLFRCGNFELASTDIGGDAWRTDSTELRGIARLDVTKFDEDAMVRRSVTAI